MAKILAQIEAHNIGNIRLFAGDAAELLAWAPPHSLARIDLIHPDPWPKRRHWKRRFVQDATVAAMARILKPSGEFRFVSDIDDYCAWTLAHLLRSPDFEWMAERAADWRLPWAGYTMTRYGRKAEREGRKAAYLRFRRVDRLSRMNRRTNSLPTVPDRSLYASHCFAVAFLRVGGFPHHALAALAAEQLDRIAVVDVAELSLVDAVAA